MLSDEADMVSPKLVEMNTIAVSYMGISPEIAKLHRYNCSSVSEANAVIKIKLKKYIFLY